MNFYRISTQCRIGQINIRQLKDERIEQLIASNRRTRGVQCNSTLILIMIEVIKI